MKNNESAPRRVALTLTYIVVFLGAVVIGGYLMTHQHQAHIPSLYLLLGIVLLACIPMLLFMRGGRNQSSNRNDEE